MATDSAAGTGTFDQSTSDFGTMQAVSALGDKAVVLNSARDLRLEFVFKGNTYAVILTIQNPAQPNGDGAVALAKLDQVVAFVKQNLGA